MHQLPLGTARTASDPSTSHKPPTTSHLLTVSQAAGDFWHATAARELGTRTLAEYSTALWYFFEFLGCDPPTRELSDETPLKFLEWLRNTPIAARMSKTRPKTFTPGSVAAFLQFPPRRRQTARLRTEQTVGKYWRHAKPFFTFLGLHTKLNKRGKGRRPNMDLPPALVPMRATVQGWWRDTLTATATPATTKRRQPPNAAQRRRVVLVQALVYLTGLRTDEALQAQRRDLEGHWLLIRQSKTGRPRIVYLNSQALGVVAGLDDGLRQRTLFDVGDDAGARKFLAGWSQTEGSWLCLCRDCTSPDQYRPGEKRHQAMRRKLATWMHRRDAVAESAQLGHGSGVVFKHYLDYLRLLPKLLEKYRLPQLEVEGFGWPSPVAQRVGRPDRLFNEIRKLINQRQEAA